MPIPKDPNVRTTWMCEEVGPVAKNKTKISVTSIFDGKQDATDVFVNLIVSKYQHERGNIYLVKEEDFRYTVDKVPDNRIPSGLCG